MQRSRCTLLLFLIFLLSSSYVPTLLLAEEETPLSKETKSEKEQLKTDQPPTTVIQFYTWAGMLPKELVDLQQKTSSNGFIDQLEKDLPGIADEIRSLTNEVKAAKTADHLQIMQVDNLQLKHNRILNQLNKSSKPLTDSITRLSKWRTDWTSKKESLTRFEKEEQLKLALAIEQKDNLNRTIDNALSLIENYLGPSLILGKAVADLQVQLHTIDTDLKVLDVAVRKASTQQTAPSILSLEFYKRINGEFFTQSYSNTLNFLKEFGTSLTETWKTIFMVIVLLTTLSIAISYSRSKIPASSAWYPFSQCPIATAVFALAISFDFATQLFFNFKPGYKWDHLLTVLTILAVIRLIRYCIEKQLHRDLLTRLSWFMAITLLLVALELPQLLILFFVFYASIVAFLIFIYQLRHKSDSRFGSWMRRWWGALPLAIIIFGVMGYDQFAINAFTTLLNTVGSFLVVWMLYRLNLGLLELVMRVVPFNLLRDNLATVVSSLQPFLAWLHGVLLVALLTVIWNIYPTLDTAINSLNNIGFSLGDFKISPGFILVVIFVLYGALLFSRAIQALLLKEVLPRYYVEKGVQLSITRLVHYAIVTIGFFFALRVLGFEFKQLTILGGALGIGIGFGLQAIVTNFASGLILLFERPIKVGDTIQVGNDLGEVKNLGLRATIIQTFDNAEIVVPNSDLVTGQVTNWTLAERKVRVKIPVGVAYGTDVSKVLEILKSCAMQNPMVLSTPKPVALFLAFGASSLDFELRCWIPEFLDRSTCTSELNQAIESEFAINNIEIPFQQTDLHIRSVDEQAAQALRTGRSDLEN